VYLVERDGQTLPEAHLRLVAGPRRSVIGQHPHRGAPPEYERPSDSRLGKPSAAIQARVEAARERQRQRFEGGSGLLSNADMGPAEVRDHCPVDDAGRSLLRAAMQQRPGGTRMSAPSLRGF
jgi:magnesium chelatase family protein